MVKEGVVTVTTSYTTRGDENEEGKIPALPLSTHFLKGTFKNGPV